ncbi:penicillin acylase family protein [Caulobacter sp. KR2-114]|uniref:penicillin acylase family protein n=1 Tax=Caulobacter sp. KR2-114 TaxID=3400912 RepID=UPI003BFF592D
MRIIGVLLGLALALPALARPALARAETEPARWAREAAAVTIVRDDWGIAHVHGHTDAQAVFGMVYAQAEDDFSRIEANYLTNLGRTALADGEGAIWGDLRQRLYVSDDDLKARYAASPAWLKALMGAWADGLNYYLATHPGTRPRALSRFEPWMALSFTEGSIGGDIERIDLKDLEAFYGKRAVARTAPDNSFHEPTGSNGIAVAPARTADGHALLLINPHTSFYFRSELQVTSDEGLNAYGAATWGQPFIYQGFNAHAGWMHTSTGADAVDEFAETIVMRAGRPFYRYGTALRPVQAQAVRVPYKAADGSVKSRTFTVYRTHHGPIVREAGGRWVAFAMMYKPVPALEQSFLRTKAHDYAGFVKVSGLQANSSNNTIFADDAGEIAYLHPQFMPRRDDRFDYRESVDGADPATDWRGLHALSELPRVLNPSTGWIANTNNWPYSAAGAASPKAADFPKYMDTAGENPRGIHAALLLDKAHGLTLDGLIKLDFDPYLPAFARLVPALVRAWEATPDSDPMKAKLADQVALLKGWDDRWAADSVATSLAVGWGEALWNATAPPKTDPEFGTAYDAMEHASPAQQLAALALACDRLTADYGTWRIPWGELNRFQRIDDAITPTFHDDAPSIAVPFTSGQWGSLASFGARRYPGTKRYYGSKGNSFVAVVEFGPRVRARAVTAGGESGDPASRHFNDEAGRYASGDFREVYFYPDQLVGHTERTYHPGP